MEKGVFKIANEHEVETLTRGGWELDEILEEDQIATVDETMSPQDVVLQLDNMQKAYSYGQQPYLNGMPVPNGVKRRMVVVRAKRYVMRQSEQSAVAAAEKRAEEAIARRSEARSAHSTVQKELETAKALAAKHEERIAQLTHDVKVYRDEAQQQRDAKRQMEQDIGKVRQAVGDLRMREIIGR